MKLTKEEIRKKCWEIKHDVAIKARSGFNWVAEHKELCISGAIVAERIISSVFKYAKKTKQEQLLEEQRMRLWDPKRGCFSYYRREPTNKEWERIEREYAKGRSYRSILDEMGLLR